MKFLSGRFEQFLATDFASTVDKTVFSFPETFTLSEFDREIPLVRKG